MTTPLPPLPEPDCGSILHNGEEVQLNHSSEAMQSYAKLAVREALLQIADDIDTWPTVAGSFYSGELRRIAEERYK